MADYNFDSDFPTNFDDTNFNPDLLADFDFSEFMAPTNAEQNVFRDSGFDFNMSFDQAAQDLLNGFDAPAQHLDGIAAPPPTPKPADEQAVPTGGDVSTCVWCSATDTRPHDLDCPLLMNNGTIMSDEQTQAWGPVDDGIDPAQASAAFLDPGYSELCAQGLEQQYHQSSPTSPAGIFSSAESPMPMPRPAVAPAVRSAYPPSPPALPFGSPYDNPVPAKLPAQSRATASGFATGHQAAYPTIPWSPAEGEVPPQYQALFASFDAARQALSAPQGIDPPIKLNLANDDWPRIKYTEIQPYATKLFTALHAQPGPPPENFSDDQTAYYYDHQSNALNTILNKLHARQTQVEARVMLLLEEILNVHEHGVPKSVSDRRDIKSGYLLEGDLRCSERLDAVIKAIDHDKYVAMDVLSGTGIADLARSPARYLRRKQENCRVNARKANDKKEALKEKAKRAETPAAPMGVRGGKKGSKRAMSPLSPSPAASQMALGGAQTGQKRKAEFPVAELLKKFRYKEAGEE